MNFFLDNLVFDSISNFQDCNIINKGGINKKFPRIFMNNILREFLKKIIEKESDQFQSLNTLFSYDVFILKQSQIYEVTDLNGDITCIHFLTEIST